MFLPGKGHFSWNVLSNIGFTFYLKHQKYSFCAPNIHPISETESFCFVSRSGSLSKGWSKQITKNYKLYVLAFFTNPKWLKSIKLDGVAPLITNPLPTSFTTVTVTCDTWHVTCDTWHMKHDMWHMTGWGR